MFLNTSYAFYSHILLLVFRDTLVLLVHVDPGDLLSWFHPCIHALEAPLMEYGGKFDASVSLSGWRRELALGVSVWRLASLISASLS